jgi:dienelactone hydrolase
MCWATKAKIRGGARRIAEQGAVAVVPPKFASRLRFERNLIERFLNIKNFRRITRYEQIPQVFLSMLSIASVFIWTH